MTDPSRAHRETAGHLATTHVPVVPATETVAAARDLVRFGSFASADLILLTGPDGRYAAAV